MTTNSIIWLHFLSVAVTAKHHNPSILNKDFLARNNIVPDSWEVVETITTPPVSIIKYSNGVVWVMDQDNLTITETYDRPFQENADSMVHDRAILYVKMLPHTPYTALDLNYTASIIHNDPDTWITQQFINTTFHNQNIIMQPRFIINVNNAVLNINFRAGNMTRKKNTGKCVVVNCNVHYDQMLNSDALQTKISEWRSNKDMVFSNIVNMMEAY